MSLSIRSFSPTDAKLATCSDDGTVRVFDFLRSSEEFILRGVCPFYNRLYMRVCWHGDAVETTCSVKRLGKNAVNFKCVLSTNVTFLYESVLFLVKISSSV